MTLERGAVISIDIVSTLAFARGQEIRVTDARGNIVPVRFIAEGYPAAPPPGSGLFVATFTNRSALVPGTYRVAFLIDGEEKIAAQVEASAEKTLDLDWSGVG